MSKSAQIDTLAVMIVDGKKIAAEIVTKLKTLPKPKKYLAAVLVGEDAASESFLKIKVKTAEELGVDFRLYKFPETIKNDDLREEVRKIALHKTCGGVIVQLPLPESINAQYILNVVPPEKDIEVLGERALGAFYAGRNKVLPPAVGVVDSILHSKFYILNSATVAVVGLGNLVGKPIAVWLMRKAQNLYLLRKGSDFSILKNADLVITGAGVPGLIKPEMLKDGGGPDATVGTGVIDFGYGTKNEAGIMNNELREKIYGDFDAELLKAKSYNLKAIWHTPTPGGTGPILVAKLFENFYVLNGGK